jgi:hypothetical protein
MDRRSFLRLLSAAVIAPAVTPGTFALGADAPVPCQPLSCLSIEEAGGSIEYGLLGIPKEQRTAFIASLARELGEIARAHLPKGQRFEIRGATPRDYGRRQAMAWYTNADMQSDPAWAPHGIVPSAPYQPEVGCYCYARQVA